MYIIMTLWRGVTIMANKITLSIAGFNLIINTTEDEDHVRKLNAVLNEDLSQILQSNPSASVTNAALLCSLDYLDRYDKATHSANNLRTQIKDYLSDAANAKLLYDDEVKKNAELTKEVQTLRAHVTKLAADGATGSANEEALRRELDSARGDAEIVRRQLKEQLDQNRSLLDRTSSLSDRLSKMDEENQRLNDLLSTASKRMEELLKLPKSVHTDDDYDALQKKYEELEERNVQLEIEIEDLTQKNEDLTLKADTYTASPVFSDEPELSSSYTVSPEPADERPAPSFGFDSYSTDSQLYPDDYTRDYSDENSAFSFADAEDQTPAYTVEESPAEDIDDDLGVEKGFKTFTQLMDEDRKERDLLQKHSAPAADTDDDDDLPNLSWINDI